MEYFKIALVLLVAGFAFMLIETNAYAENLCQYASSANATSESSAGSLAIYATGAPNAPYVGNCTLWSGYGYTWSPANWNVKANLTLKYDKAVNVDNFTIFGDYDMCWNRFWLKNSGTGEERLVFWGFYNACYTTHIPGINFSADMITIETCGWSWSSTDAVQLCGSRSVSSVCGNGVKEPGEECDDNNTVGGDGCSPTCFFESSVCGNGRLEQPPAYPNSTEQCDDNNTVNGDGCSNTCAFEPNICGNGRLEMPPQFPNSTEQCDDNNTVGGDGCSSTCSFEPSICGNGLLEIPPAYPNSTEQCDDNNTVSWDGCSATCLFEPSICGNGRLETPPRYPNSTEQCDDNNTFSGDGCSSTCLIEASICGNGILETPPQFPNSTEQCDLGPLNGMPNSTCSINCKNISEGPRITIISPGNQSYSSKWLWANVTLNKPALWCGASLNGTENQTLTNGTATDWHLNISVPSENSNNVQFWCNDTLGGVGSSQVFFTIDTIAPSVTMAPPLNPWYRTPPVINGTAADSQGVVAVWTNTSYYSGISTSSPFIFTNTTELPQGTISIEVFANDSAGNVGSATQAFGFDSIAPASIDYVYPTENNGSYKSANWYYVNATFAEANPGECILEVGGANYTMAQNGTNCHTNITGQADGAQTYKIYANDLAGNMNVSAARTVTLDTAMPFVQIILPENKTYNSTGLSLNYTASDANLDAVWYEYNGSNITLFGNASFTAIDNRQSKIVLFANDSAGNVNSASITFTVDTAAPEIFLNLPLDGALVAPGNITFNFTAIDNFADSVRCSIYFDGINQTDSSVANNTSTSFSVEGIGEGLHYWNVSCRDIAGNSASSATRNFTASHPLTTIVVVSPHNTTYSQKWVWANVTLDGDASRCGVSLNENSSQNITSSSPRSWWLNLSVPAEGLQNVVFSCNDAVGNGSLAYFAGPVYFTIHTTPPSITIQSPQNETYGQNWVWANVTLDEDAIWCGVSLNGMANHVLINSTAIDWYLNLSVPSEGSNDALFFCNDTFGNMGSNASFFTVNTTIPPNMTVNQSVCGNGVLETPPAFPNSTEQCDDNNTISGDGCSSICAFEPSICGNGRLEAPPAYLNSTEQCDDNNTINGDGCSSACIFEPNTCGNGRLEAPPQYPNSTEVCDDNNTVNGDGCSATCLLELPICGNGRLEQPPQFQNSTEQCDDNNTQNSDGCSSTCQFEFSICQYASSANATSENPAGSLATYATGAPNAQYAGDCSRWSGYGYSWSPKNWNVKANLTLKYNKPVDVSNFTIIGDYDVCWRRMWLMNSTSGAKVQVFDGFEENCNSTHIPTMNFHADSIILETCGWSWSSTDAVQLCGNVIPISVCGDGRLEQPPEFPASTEQCDDGNNITGDGCSTTCKIEPSVCGNGILERAPEFQNSTEQCDDNNTVSGDGCNSACHIENITGTGCQFAISAEATGERPGYEARYVAWTPDSDGNCTTSPSPDLKSSWWKQAGVNVSANITLTFPLVYAENLTVFGDYDLCINRVWFWRDGHWYLAQAGNMDRSNGSYCRIDYNFSDMAFATSKVKLEVCNWRASAIDAAKICGSTETYPSIQIVSPLQDSIATTSNGSVPLIIATNTPSTCQFHYERNFDIGDGINLSTADGLTHSYNLSVSASKESATIYYKCTGSAGKATPYSVMHRISFGDINSPGIEVCNWYNCTEGAASLSFDDGYQPALGYVSAVCKNKMDEKGIKGTYFLAYTNKYNSTDWNIWKNAYAGGHEIGGHSVLHNCTENVTLERNFLINDTEANIAQITGNIGMPAYELTTYAWPCGEYYPEYGDWLAPYYRFARGYHLNRIESKNPENFWNLKSINSAGFGDDPPDYFTMADVAENYQDWSNYVYHDTCNNPEIIDYLKSKNIWTDTIGSVSKYIKERQNATMQNAKNTTSGVKFDLINTMNSTIFNKELTLRIYLGNKNITNITVNGAKANVTNFSVNGLRYAKFNVPAGANNTIEISGLKMNIPYCGDGKINQKSEECDDENNITGDGCSGCKNEIKAYIVPYVGDIDGTVSAEWFTFYDRLWSWHENNSINSGFSFYARGMQNRTWFTYIIGDFYWCNSCELILKSEGNGTDDLDNMTYEQVKALIGSDRNDFKKAMEQTYKITNVTMPQTYNQKYGRFTKTIRSAVRDLGFNMYLEQYVTDEYGYTNPMPDFDITQYAVTFTYSGLPGYNETFKQPNKTIQELLDFEDDHMLYINGIKVIPLATHQQDFMVQDTNLTLNITKWEIYTSTLLALKNDTRFKLLKPQDVYALRHPA